MQSTFTLADISSNQPLTIQPIPFSIGASYHVYEAVLQSVPPSFVSSQGETSARDSFLFPNKKQATATLNWLLENFEGAEGFSLPRNLIYKHYALFCDKSDFCPLNAASFGKIIRQVFPHLQARRLGIRGQSKYHYYGIRVKDTCPQYKAISCEQKTNVLGDRDMKHCFLPDTDQTEVYSSTPEQLPQPSNAEGRKQKSKPTTILKSQPLSPASLVVASGGSILPEFPEATSQQITSPTSVGQVNFLISSYRAHCIQILETILRGRLQDVGMFLDFYWQHLNDSTRGMLEQPYVAKLIAICDTILYQTILGVLVPVTVQPLPASLLKGIRNFALKFVKDVETAVRGLPCHLFEAKKPVAKRFSQMLKRKTTLAHLSQANRAILSSDTTLKQMLNDWDKRTEHWAACSQLAWISADGGFDANLVMKYMERFAELLRKKMSIEDHIHWLEMLFIKCIAKGDQKLTEKSMRTFCMQWCYLSNLIIRDQTLRSASSFGSFHLINLLYQEYLLFVTDIYRNQREEEMLWRSVFEYEVSVPDYYLTSTLICDLEECVALDTASNITTAPNPEVLSDPAVEDDDNNGDSILLPSSTNPYLTGELKTEVPGMKLSTPKKRLESSSQHASSPDISSSIFKLTSLPLSYAGLDQMTSASRSTIAKGIFNAAKSSKNKRQLSDSFDKSGYSSGHFKKAETMNGNGDVSTSTNIDSKLWFRKDETSSAVGTLTYNAPIYARNCNPIYTNSVSQAYTSTFLKQPRSSATTNSTITGGISHPSATLSTSLSVIEAPVDTQDWDTKNVTSSESTNVPSAKTINQTKDNVVTIPCDIKAEVGASGKTLQELLKNITQCSLVPPGRYMATRLVKVTNVTTESDSGKEPITLQLTVPFNQEFSLNKGQILSTEDGKSYLINEVQTVLRPI